MTEYDADIAALWDRFKSNAAARLETLHAWQHGDADADAALHEAHKLAGALGSYGRPEGSHAAAELELRLRDHVGGSAPDLRSDPEVTTLLERIAQCLR